MSSLVILAEKLSAEIEEMKTPREPWRISPVSASELLDS
jgi:hypothetical protein